MHYERINAALAKDQGKIFNRNGSGGYTTDLHGRKIRYYAWKDSSYGEPDGLLGINCGHHVYPFTPGIDVQRYFPYDEKENDALYQKMQHQRELERRVRRSKRECMMLETTGDTEGFAKASVTLKQREQALKQYCADEGLDYKNDRTAVVGYGRSTAAKASAAAKRKLAEQTRKRLDKSAESGIIQEKIRLYNIHNETDVGVFTAEEIESAMQSSPIGRSTMHYIESEGMSIEMNYDLNVPDWLCGSISGRQVSINVQNHSNAIEVTETIIHEIAHHRFSWDKTQEDEVNCRIYEYLHTHDTISDTMISEIVSFVKSEYDDFPEGDLYGY